MIDVRTARPFLDDAGAVELEALRISLDSNAHRLLDDAREECRWVARLDIREGCNAGHVVVCRHGTLRLGSRVTWFGWFHTQTVDIDDAVSVIK